MATTKMKDACDLLDADHKAVKKMFTDYEDLTKAGGNNNQKKRALADKICSELSVHMQIEEGIFYPAIRKPVKDDAMMNEAEVEHAGAKNLITQIQEMNVSDPMLVAQREPSEEDLKTIEAQAMRVQTEAYFKDRRTSIRPICS